MGMSDDERGFFVAVNAACVGVRGCGTFSGDSESPGLSNPKDSSIR